MPIVSIERCELKAQPTLPRKSRQGRVPAAMEADPAEEMVVVWLQHALRARRRHRARSLRASPARRRRSFQKAVYAALNGWGRESDLQRPSRRRVAPSVTNR